MLSHKKIWSAIDKIARESGLTPSGLAKKAGLDPTSFNKSKRAASGGKLRWPSTESLYKLLKALKKDLSYFSSLVEPESFSELNVMGSIQGKNKGFYEASEGNELEKIAFPRSFSPNIVAIKVKDYSLAPIYKNGDTLIVSNNEEIICEGDRVVVRTTNNEILIKNFVKKEKTSLVLKSLDKEDKIKINNDEIVSVSRIMWVSQ